MIAAGAVLAGVGALRGHGTHLRVEHRPPPGFFSVILGPGLLELGSLYVYTGSAGWSRISVPALLFPVAGLALLLAGARSWWRGRAQATVSLVQSGPARGVPGDLQPPRRVNLPRLLQALALAVVATGIVAVLNWADSACSGCALGYVVPNPVSGLYVILAGSAVLTVGLLVGARTPGGGGLLTGIDAIEAGLGGAVIGMIPTVLFTGYLGYTPLPVVYAILVAVTGGVLWAAGATFVR